MVFLNEAVNWPRTLDTQWRLTWQIVTVAINYFILRLLYSTYAYLLFVIAFKLSYENEYCSITTIHSIYNGDDVQRWKRLGTDTAGITDGTAFFFVWWNFHLFRLYAWYSNTQLIAIKFISSRNGLRVWPLYRIMVRFCPYAIVIR